MRHHELTDEEWAIIAQLLPNQVWGVARVADRRVINGILWRFRSSAPWRDAGGDIPMDIHLFRPPHPPFGHG